MEKTAKVVEQLKALRPGAFTTIVTEKVVDVKGVGTIKKCSSLVVRLKCRHLKEISKSFTGDLPWGKWSDEAPGVIIEHCGKAYLRVYLDLFHKSHGPKSVYAIYNKDMKKYERLNLESLSEEEQKAIKAATSSKRSITPIRTYGFENIIEIKQKEIKIC